MTFDASATTAASTTRPFHEILYTWNFGDAVPAPASGCGSSINAGEGFWACGAAAGKNSKNLATGPEAAHVYESAGTYQVCLTGQNAVGMSQPLCQTITVADGATSVWAGTNTVCFSVGGDFTGCPSGALQITVGSSDFGAVFNANKAAGKRYLLRRGDTFNISTSANINVTGPSLIGAYGSGAKPIIAVTTNGVTIFAIDSPSWPTTTTSDWRFQDLDLRGTGFTGTFGFAGFGTLQKFLIERLDFSHMNKSVALTGLNLTLPNEPIYNNLVIQDVRSQGLVTACTSSGENAFLVEAEALHILGTYINNQNTGEHGIRSHWSRKGSFTNNTITGICGGKVPMTIRGGVDGGMGHQLDGTIYNEKIVIADNYIVGSPSSGMISVGPQNGNFAEKGADVIIERNYLDASGGGGNLGILWPDVTVRNNLAREMGTFAGIGWDDNTGNLPVPTRVNFYNNSSYSTTTSPGTAYIYFAGGGTAPLNSAGTTFDIRNNIRYLPNTGGALTFDITGGGWSGATITASNNTSSVSTSPNWTTTLPTSAAGFKPLAGSYAIGAGVAVPGVLYDFFGVARTSPPDMGAVVH